MNTGFSVTDANGNLKVTNPALVIGTTVEAWDAPLEAIAALSTTGMVARTGAATYTPRTITAGTGIAVTNGDGVAGAPSIALSAATASGGIFTVVVKLTDAQIKSLSTVPITLLAGQGANIVTQVVFLAALKSTTGGTYSAGTTLSTRYAAIGADTSTGINFTNSTNIQFGRALASGATVADGTDVRNVGVVIRSTADVTGGNVANFITVMLGYSLFDTTRTS